MKRILFVCYGGGHVNMVIPVLRKLAGREDIHCDVLGLTTAAETLRQQGFKSLGFADFLRKDDHRAREIGESLVESNSSNAVSRAESVAYLGLSYHDLEISHGIAAAKNIYASKGRQGFLPITVLERIIDQIRPDLIVATNSPRAEQAAILAAHNRGIPAVCMVDLLATREIEWIGQAGFADRLCVLSQNVADKFIAFGRNPHEIVVTGNPAFDKLVRPGLAEDAANLRKSRGWGTDWVILWASQPEPERHPYTGKQSIAGLNVKILEALYAAVARNTDWRLVVRPHPSEGSFRGILPPRVELSNSSEELPLLLKAVDVVVTMTSTVGLEATLLGKPLITVDLSIFTADMPYAELGLSRGVSDLSKLENILEEARSNDWHPNTGLGEVGHAAANVVTVIDEILAAQ